MTICNIYLPDIYWRPDDLQDLVRQRPAPFIILGDFNSHNTLWSSSYPDHREKAIEEILQEFNLNIVNTGEGTYINSRSNALSQLHLTICSPILEPNIKCNFLDEYNTDHIPIIIEFADRIKYENIPKSWLPNKTNWHLYSELLESFIPENVGDITFFLKHSTGAATVSVPITKSCAIVKKVPWWNQEIAEAVKKKGAFNSFKRNMTRETLIDFKQLRARAHYLIVEAKKRFGKSISI